MTWKLVRVAHRRDKVVHWQNGLGPWLGQHGSFEFTSEEEADRFIAYATSDGAPPLDPASMSVLGFEYTILEESKA